MNLENYNCQVCALQIEETAEHLFLQCPFAQDCWGSFNLETVENGDLFGNFEAFRIQLDSRFFMETIILICWTIWVARNELIFNANQMNLTECKSFFFKEAKLLGFRVKDSLSIQFNQWLQALEMT